MPKGDGGEGMRSVNDLSMDEMRSLLRKSSQSSLFRCPLQCPIDRDHTIDIAHLKSHITDCRRVALQIEP